MQHAAQEEAAAAQRARPADIHATEAAAQVAPVPAQMWEGRAQHPVPAQMWRRPPSPVLCPTSPS
jgi:hypothetical protein